MPVIVVGADTLLGEEILQRLTQPDREVRAFITDPTAAESLRERGVKVAIGDVSDDSHVSSACLNCFSAVLVDEAAQDDRVRAFAADPDSVITAWATAVAEAGVKRVIWVTSRTPPPVADAETVVVDPAVGDVAGYVYRLDEAAALDNVT